MPCEAPHSASVQAGSPLCYVAVAMASSLTVASCNTAPFKAAGVSMIDLSAGWAAEQHQTHALADLNCSDQQRRHRHADATVTPVSLGSKGAAVLCNCGATLSLPVLVPSERVKTCWHDLMRTGMIAATTMDLGLSIVLLMVLLSSRSIVSSGDLDVWFCIDRVLALTADRIRDRSALVGHGVTSQGKCF